jgi:hypothetical protein
MDDSLNYLTLYLPYGGKLARYVNSRLISDEALEWLNVNVGLGTLSGMEWTLGYPDRQHEWCYMGTTHSPESHYTEVARVFTFRDPAKATMFKLVWGG